MSLSTCTQDDSGYARGIARTYVQESKWHESQQLTPQKDGSLLATFDLIDALERETNRSLYELYGLTPDEIEIIDESMH